MLFRLRCTPARRPLPLILALIVLCSSIPRLDASDDDITITRDIVYLEPGSTNAYALEKCQLDLYLPKAGDEPFPLLVWFHGGGLKGGARTSSVSQEVAKSLAARGVGVAMADYRLSPRVRFPEYLEDSAQAVRWAVEHASSLKAQPRIYVGGHSAGGYLAALLAMDGHYLKDAGVDMSQIAGFIPVSGQMMTHFTIAEERGLKPNTISADEAAPIYFLTKEAPPLLVLIGDDDWPARLEENRYFVAALQKVGENNNVSLHLIKGRDHGSILKKMAETNDPASGLILDFMRKGSLPKTE